MNPKKAEAASRLFSCAVHLWDDDGSSTFDAMDWTIGAVADALELAGYPQGTTDFVRILRAKAFSDQGKNP